MEISTFIEQFNKQPLRTQDKFIEMVIIPTVKELSILLNLPVWHIVKTPKHLLIVSFAQNDTNPSKILIIEGTTWLFPQFYIKTENSLIDARYITVEDILELEGTIQDIS